MSTIVSIMNGTHFEPDFPGRLVPATVYEKKVSSRGVPESAPIHGTAFVPDDLPPKRLDQDAFVGRLAPLLLEADRNLIRLEGRLAQLPDANLLLKPFQKKEAAESSKIEDTVASIEEIAMMEAEVPPPRDEVREVWNNLRAIEYALQSPLPVCLRLFKEVHAILLDGVRGEEMRPGEFRSVQVYIGDKAKGFDRARFVPPPPENVVGCLESLERFINPSASRPKRMPDLIELALAHYQFECIHPFNDGNGRLGRLLVNIAPCKSGALRYPISLISEFMDRHREEYYDRLKAVSTHGEWEAWTAFFLRAISEQAISGLVLADRLIGLRNRMIDAVTTKQGSGLTIRLVDLLFIRQVVNVRQVAEQLGVTPPAARKHVNRFVEMKLLQETPKKYDRRYISWPIIRAIEGDENPWPDGPAVQP